MYIAVRVHVLCWLTVVILGLWSIRSTNSAANTASEDPAALAAMMRSHYNALKKEPALLDKALVGIE